MADISSTAGIPVSNPSSLLLSSGQSRVAGKGTPMTKTVASSSSIPVTNGILAADFVNGSPLVLNTSGAVYTILESLDGINTSGIYKNYSNLVQLVIASSNITLDMNGFTFQSSATAVPAVNIYIDPGVSNVTIRNGTIRNAAVCAIASNGASQIMLSNLNLLDTGSLAFVQGQSVSQQYAIQFTDCPNVTIQDVTVNGLQAHVVTGASIKSPDQAEVAGIYLERCNKATIRRVICNDMTITGVAQLAAGINLLSCSEATIEGIQSSNIQVPNSGYTLVVSGILNPPFVTSIKSITSRNIRIRSVQSTGITCNTFISNTNAWIGSVLLRGIDMADVDDVSGALFAYTSDQSDDMVHVRGVLGFLGLALFNSKVGSNSGIQMNNFQSSGDVLGAFCIEQGSTNVMCKNIRSQGHILSNKVDMMAKGADFSTFMVTNPDIDPLSQNLDFSMCNGQGILTDSGISKNVFKFDLEYCNQVFVSQSVNATVPASSFDVFIAPNATQVIIQ